MIGTMDRNDQESNIDYHMELGIIGVPVSKGQRKCGTERGPKFLREGGLVDRLTEIGCKVNDYGDADFGPVGRDPSFDNVKNPRCIAHGSLKTADMVEHALRTNGRCLALGGDHSMAIGTIMGHARVNPNLVVLWIDAHADINTPLTSDSGNIHGMPLSFLAKELDKYVPNMPGGWEEIQPCISVDQVAWIGLRDVDPAERKIIEKYNMKEFSMQDVDKDGIHKVLERALKAVDPEGIRPIHVSFDIDGMDPIHTPSTGTPVSGGLSMREMCFIGEELANTGRLAMVDVAEVNPNLGSEYDTDLTVKTTIDVLVNFFGNQRDGMCPPDYKIPVVPKNMRRGAVHPARSEIVKEV